MGEVNYAPLIDDMVWSYSRIKAFEDCPYRWYLKYIKRFHGKDMFFSSYGTFMHKLIELYHKGEKTPRQIVDPDHGKQAVSRWRVKERNGGQTLVELYPDTGRTHQLRVHCAHPQGLNAPIHGDRLYGKGITNGSKLCLRAKSITLTLNGERRTFSYP